MMSRFSTLTVFFLATVLCLQFLQSCEIAGEVVLDAEDLTVSMVENQAEGTSIGQIKATSDGAALNFEVISSNPENALQVDARTGLLTIATAAHFDFEERNTISAQVRVSADDQSQVVEIVIELKDALAAIEDWNEFTAAWKTTAFSDEGTTVECRMDDQLTISGTGKYVYTPGNDGCEEDNMIWQEEGSWDLDENLQFVIFDKGTPNEIRAKVMTFEVEELVLKIELSGREIYASFSTL